MLKLQPKISVTQIFDLWIVHPNNNFLILAYNDNSNKIRYPDSKITVTYLGYGQLCIQGDEFTHGAWRDLNMFKRLINRNERTIINVDS
jgi:hypothetical protein